MKTGSILSVGLALLLLSPTLQAGKRSRKPPRPLNKQVRYQPYQDTDLAQIVYKTSRREFRVGHPPYRPARFHVAEYVLVSGHLARYERPDLSAEIKLAPGRSKPTLTANKTFQEKFKLLVGDYRKFGKVFAALKVPRECRAAQALYLAAWRDEIALARAIVKRLFAAQQIRDRELVCRDIEKTFAKLDAKALRKLCDRFEQEGNLSVFYPEMVKTFIDKRLARARQLADKAMAQVGVEYAVSAEEKPDKPIE